MSTTDLAAPDKATIRDYFDAIASRYDFLNHFLSFRLDESWRRRALKIVLDGGERSVLDLGVGTGKFLRACLARQSWQKAAGLDFSLKMLACARRELPDEVRLISADFHDLPFKEESFDLVLSSFTLRSVKDMPKFLAEIYRLLAPEGKAAFLCLTRPRNLFFKILYYPYLKLYLPLVGRWLSGHAHAYDFLSQSIQKFQSPTKTVERMKQAGFRTVEVHALTLGAATLFLARK